MIEREKKRIRLNNKYQIKANYVISCKGMIDNYSIFCKL